MNRAKLKQIVESIEAAEKGIKDLSGHKRDLYADNKDEFEPKVLRKIIARRRMEPDLRKRDDDLLDQYENALGMTGELARAAASGEKTYQEAADDAGVSRRTMARHVARARVPKATANGAIQPELEKALATILDHDPETGECLSGRDADGVVIEVPAASQKGESQDGDSERRSDPVGCDGADDTQTESHGGPAAVRNGGGDDDRGHLNLPTPEVARVAPSAVIDDFRAAQAQSDAYANLQTLLREKGYA